MELSQQVTSLDLSKKLKELGVKQESLCYWTDGELIINNPSLHELGWNYDNNCPFIYPLGRIFNESKDVKEIYSAFTINELIKIFPDKFDLKIQNTIPIAITINQRNILFNDNISNGIAIIIINLIENNLMEIK